MGNNQSVIMRGVINPIISPIDYSALDNFVNYKIIQDYLSKEKKESKDQAFKNLKEFEFRELKKIFDENYHNYITNLQKERIIIIWNNLVEEIIKNENSSIVYKKKIIDEILSIKNNDNIYQINHLKILLVGRKGVGKTTLINYMLNLEENKINNNNSLNNFTVYENKNVPYLKLVEFRGFGLDKNCNPEEVGEEALKHIQNEIINNKNGDYNDFFHCIWYCISGTRFEESEKSVLIKLSNAYNDKKIPIIIVYTQNIDNIVSNKMIKFIQDIGLKTSFIKVLAKDMNLMFCGAIRKAFGRDELLNETLRKCTMTLQGDFINFMIDIISDDIKGKILEKNKSLEKEINYKIINNFINDYKCVLNEEEFKNYITEMIGKGLFTFYENYNKKISNKSLNFLKNSNIIKSVNNCIIKYELVVNQIIKDNLNQKAQIFLDQQAAIEKKNKFNIRLENKRYLKGFEESIKSFIKRNFYFISQKIIISYIIKNFCYEYIMKYREKLDDLVKSYLEKENRDKEINDYLKDCFLSKLEKFSKKYKIDIKIIHPQLIDSFKEIQDTENFDKGNENINSIKTFDDFEYGQVNQINNVENKKGDHWLPFVRDKFKYLNEKSLTLLKDFMENKMEYQDIYFKYDNSDKIFAALKIYELNDLINSFNSQKKTFINDIINKTYNNNITIMNDISFKKSIVSSKQFENVYINKINKEIEKINKEENICKIEYLSIIVIGPSGVGKSTLINGMLNEELAKT